MPAARDRHHAAVCRGGGVRTSFAAGADAHAQRPAHDADDDGWTLGNAIRHHAFWALFATFFFTAIGMYSISAQVVAYLVDAGFTPLQAATAWGFSGVVLVVGMLGVPILALAVSPVAAVPVPPAALSMSRAIFPAAAP